MNTKSLNARFVEALAPLGLPDSSPPASGDDWTSARASRLRDVVAAVARPIVIGLMTVMIHLAALKYVFLRI